jgi:spermidine synthase
MNRRRLAALGLFFFLSGATALFYEILWMRQLILVFGSTTYAVSAVLSAYMMGLALGSFAFGRAADRAVNLVRAYGLLEIGIGLYALVAPMLLRSVAPIFVRIWGDEPSPGTLAVLTRFAGSLVILLPPTILMGGTLPVLSRVFATPGGEHSGPVGRLYAINTFGAVAGTFLAGFVLLPLLGARRATLAAAGVNVALGIGAVLLSRARWASLAQAPAQPPETARAHIEDAPPLAAAGGSGPTGLPHAPDPSVAAPVPAAAATAPSRGLVLVVFALSGFAAMLYEVGWTRALALTIGSSVYGFTLMLIAFLAGLAAGAALFARISSRTASGARLLALVLAGIGAASWATSLLIHQLPYYFARLFAWTHGANVLLHAAELGLCLLIMFPATLLMGGVFPLVLRLHAGHDRQVGRRVGEAYAANTVGTVLGSAAAGFLLLPALGVRTTLLLAVAMDLAIAALVLAGTLRRPAARLASAAAGAAAAVLVFMASPGWDVLMMNSGVYIDTEVLPEGFTRRQFEEFAVGKDEIVYYKEGMNASVLVGRDGAAGTLYLKVNGKADASTGIDMRTQVLLGQIPLLFHPDPKNVLVIGLASGISLGSVATHPVEKIRVLEVEPAMLEACRAFSEFNHNVLDDPRLKVVFNDARNDILLRNETYDVIVSEPSNPWMTVASNLFTREFFQEAHARLAPGGIFCQWFQVYSLAPEDMRALIATFHSVFPNVLAFGVGDASDLVVLGSDRPLPLDFTALQARMSELGPAVDLGRVGVRSPEDLLAHLCLAAPGLEEYVKDARLNTDDNALIEFSAPLSLHSETVWANRREMLRHMGPIPALLSGLPEDPGQRRDVFLNLAGGLLSNGRPKAALAVLSLAEETGQDDRSRRLRETIQDQIAHP